MEIDGRSKATESDPIAYRLLELAIKAGWKPVDCLQFARAAHEFVLSTLPDKVHQKRVASESFELVPTTRSAEASRDQAKRPSARRKPAVQTGDESLAQRRAKLEWSSNLEIRRRALQTLADQNRTMAEAAETLGVSHSTVASTAFKLKISFHGRRGSQRPRRTAVRSIGGAPKLAKPIHTRVNGKAVASSAGSRSVDQHMQRRCPSCNRIFKPEEISHYLCDDCETGSHAAR
jgi:hypothetical protein